MTRSSALLAALLVALGSASCGGGEPSPKEQASAVRDWTKDPRLAGMMEECASKGSFSGDTSQLLPVLVSKLESGSMKVLHNVREELAREGSAAVPELVRLVRRLYTEPHGSHAVVNSLGVLRLSDAGGDPEALVLLRDCLGHPQQTVRTAAVKALSRHATAELYDDLLSLMPAVDELTRATLLTALHQADGRRFEDTLAGWIIAGEYPGLWSQAARSVAQSADEATGAKFADFAAGLGDPATRAFLLATGARAGDASASERLVELIAEDDPQLRGTGLSALEFSGLYEPAIPVLRGDPVPALRAMAVGLLALHTDDLAAREALRDALADVDDTVRQASLSALLAAGDAGAADFAVDALTGPQRDLQLAVRAMAQNWEANPGLDGRVLTTLTELLDERSVRPLRERATLYQAIGQVPGETSALLLLDAAASERGDHQGMSAYRWFTIQASNTGPLGRAVLFERWRSEPDLERRLDLLWAATVSDDELSATTLREVLQGERSAPHERLFAAERLAQNGPASEVAPLIKRATLRESDPVFRPAMNCLLWRWYGRS